MALLCLPLVILGLGIMSSPMPPIVTGAGVPLVCMPIWILLFFPSCSSSSALLPWDSIPTHIIHSREWVFDGSSTVCCEIQMMVSDADQRQFFVPCSHACASIMLPSGSDVGHPRNAAITLKLGLGASAGRDSSAVMT